MLLINLFLTWQIYIKSTCSCIYTFSVDWWLFYCCFCVCLYLFHQLFKMIERPSYKMCVVIGLCLSLFIQNIQASWWWVEYIMVRYIKYPHCFLCINTIYISITNHVTVVERVTWICHFYLKIMGIPEILMSELSYKITALLLITKFLMINVDNACFTITHIFGLNFFL